MENKNPAGEIMDFALLKKYKVPVLPYAIVGGANEAAKAAHSIGYPVTLKAISDKILHKSEYHAISLNVRDEGALLFEASRIMAIMKNQGDAHGKLLVQKYMYPRFELILGGKTDAQFGPTVMVGLGGIYTEILQDASIRICPPSDNDMRSMVSQLKAFPILKGARGQKGINLSQLEKIIRCVSNLMEGEQPKELDINPLFCTNEGLFAADVRVLR